MRKIIFLLLLSATAFAQSSTEVVVNDLIRGTLYKPESAPATNLVILIAGSGPTNRSGNQIGSHNNSLKYLAEGLAANGIATFSFDKRVVAQMIQGINSEKGLRFEQQIDDVRDIIRFFRSTNDYKNIIIAGHSEGSLIGMVAAQNNAEAYISLAGAGRTIDKVVTEQIGKQMPSATQEMIKAFEDLSADKDIKAEHPIVVSFFRPALRPFLKAWVALDPQQEIKKLNVPVLIVNGTKDIQVGVSEAELLKSAKPAAELQIIPNMNHVFKEIAGDDEENVASYNNPKLPVMPQLINIVTEFVRKL